MKKTGKTLAAALAVISAFTMIPGSVATAEQFEPFWALVCLREEHTHDESCYTEQLICGLEESEEHTHTTECYEKVLICGKQEHTHDYHCRANLNADRETEADWDAFFCNFHFSGNWGTDIVSVALSQEGYRESGNNFIMDADDMRHGYTRYADWYNRAVFTGKDEWWYMNRQYDDWCCSFASYCLCYAGVPREAICWGNGSSSWQINVRSQGLLSYRHDGYIPNPGDIIFFSHARDTLADHVGVVKGVDLDRRFITVIEGNNGPEVTEFYYKMNDEDIFAYCNVSQAQELWNEKLHREEEERQQREENRQKEEAATEVGDRERSGQRRRQALLALVE